MRKRSDAFIQMLQSGFLALLAQRVTKDRDLDRFYALGKHHF